MQLIDVDYYVKKNIPIIRLWFKEGNKVFSEEDNTFEPYFYAWHKDLDKKAEAIRHIKVKQNGDILVVKRIEKHKKKILGKEKTVLKIVTFLPSHVPIFRELFLRMNIDVFDASILFPIRYLIDKELKLFEER